MPAPRQLYSEVRWQEYALVEDEEALEDLKILLVEYGASDTVVKLLIRKRALGLKALVRERGPTSTS
jgi:hypothetical protein